MAESRAMAVQALAGVGDAALGEWAEDGQGGVAHLRRRLSVAEQGDLQVRDIRGLAEESQRIAVLLAAAPHLARWL